MRRTWIGAASAAALATAAATGFAVAQQQPRQEQAPASQQMERGQAHHGAANGAMERGQSAQAQSPGEERLKNERTGQNNERMGQEGMKPGEQGKPGQTAQRAGEQGQSAQTEKMNNEKMNNEKRAGEENKGNAQGAQLNREKGSAAEQKNGQANPAEKGKTNQAAGTENRATEEKGKTAAGQTPANEKAQTGQNEMKNNRQGEAQTGQNAQNPQNGQKGQNQNARAETHVNPQNVRAEGNAHLTKDRAVRIADTIMATATPQNVNVKIAVGAPLPGDVRLMPLPATIVDLVPEYRDYDYVVVNDEIAIVQPSTRHVVEVINTGGGVAMNNNGEQAMAGTRVNPCGTP